MSAVIPAPRVVATDRIFYTGMAVLSAAIVAIGFSPTFFMRGAALGPLSPLLVVHGLVFTAWIGLFIVQTSLIAANQRAWHRALGTLGVAVAVAVVTLGTLAAIDALRLGRAPVAGLDPRSFFAIPMRNMATFPVLVAAAVWLRGDAQWHKRLMLLATISMLDAALARFPFPWIMAAGPPAFYGMMNVLIIAGMAYDRWTRGRVHPAYWWGGGFILLSEIVFLAISGTPLWLSFADRFLAP